MNGSQGIVPTVDLATNNNGYAYPVMPYGYGNNGFGNGMEWILGLVALGMFTNGGMWGNGNNQVATTDFVSSQFTQEAVHDLSTQVCSGFANTNSTIANGNQNLSNLISNGFADAATNLCNVRSDVLLGNMGLQNSILDSKYADAINSGNVIREIVGQTNELNTNLLTTQLNAQAHLDKCCCDLKELIRADGDETRALITQNTIQDLRDRLTAAKDVISDQRTEANIINSLRPYPVPAYITGSPYVGYGYGFNNGFYGNGFYGNTII